MKLNISTELDLVAEIPVLLQISVMDYEVFKTNLINDFNNLGVNGEAFYNKNLKVFEKYVKAFKKHMTINEADMFLLKEEDPTAYMTMHFVLLSNINIYKNIDSFSENDLLFEFLKSYNENFETNFTISNINSLEDILSLLEKSNLKENTKWRFLLLMQNPKKYYTQFVQLINKNLDAYNIAIKTVEKDLKTLINKYIKFLQKDGYNLLDNIFSKLSKNITVVPSLVSSNIILAPNDIIYFGLLSENLHDEQMKSLGIKSDLILKLKALSDKSKMDILLLLRSGCRYNLEIAEALSLTPATTSYHMSSLLESSMVSVTKEDGRCYYHFEPKSIEKLIIELESTFLKKLP